MIRFIKSVPLVIVVIITLWHESNASVIPAAVIRRHTVTYKDVPMPTPQIRHPIVYVPASKLNLVMQFKSKSNNIHVKQVHKSQPGKVQYSQYVDPPHILKHEVQKPVIQTIREVIVPYRSVVQQIHPVVEDVKTVVATGVPHSTVYMNYGHNSVADNYGYSVTTDHESAKQYSTYDSHSDDKTVQSTHSSGDSKPSLYDLSSIYGINPSVRQLTGYLHEPKPSLANNDNHVVYDEPVVYGLTTDYQQNSGDSRGKYEYVVNTVHDRPESAERAVQYNGHSYDNMEAAKHQVYDQYVNYEQAYNYQDKPETNYIDQGYYSTVNNIDNSVGYESNTNPGYQPMVANEGYVSSGYSDGYSGDLATSDGSPLQTQPTMLSMYEEMPVSKQSTLANLAQLMSSLAYQYNYDSQTSPISYS